VEIAGLADGSVQLADDVGRRADDIVAGHGAHSGVT
jgi:hypothetical protein